MTVVERLSSIFAGIRSRIARRESEIAVNSQLDPSPQQPAVDPAEEFQKIQRGLRRLSLASDRSGDVLQAVAARLDEMQQTLLTQNRPQPAVLTLDEAQLLQLLDQLDRVAGVPDLAAVAGALLQEAKTALLASARWRPVTVPGAAPDGADIRIAEFIGDPATEGPADIRIHRILEQGYRRADGTLLRPGVVIAGAIPQTPVHLHRGTLT
jgi:hypothetical protein